MRHAGSLPVARSAVASGRARDGADVVPALDPNKDMRQQSARSLVAW
jgi:H2-forming N5,N10-methylenetetrahydromethanopterin dehydrogenase-like enzyme